MVAVNSTMLPLGTAAPNFTLPDTSGRMVSVADFKHRPLLVMFMCSHCPYVRLIRHGLAQLAKDYQPHGVAVVAINSNDVLNYPADDPKEMVKEINDAGYIFPYLIDETQLVAQTYRAACTPDFFLFDRGHHLVYRGQFDDSRPGNGQPVTGTDLRVAINAVLAGKEPLANQKPSIGCNIKWIAGNEPDYA
jgi:thiol-disulfide isomerase/thioredoxin